MIDRVMTGNNSQWKIITLKALRDNTSVVDSDKTAEVIYKFVVGGTLDMDIEVVNSTIMLHNTLMLNRVYRAIVNDTIRYILVELLTNDWKELRMHIYMSFSFDTLTDAVLTCLIRRLSTIYTVTDGGECARLIQCVCFMARNYGGNFTFIHTLSPGVSTLTCIHTPLELLVVVFLLNRYEKTESVKLLVTKEITSALSSSMPLLTTSNDKSVTLSACMGIVKQYLPSRFVVFQ